VEDSLPAGAIAVTVGGDSWTWMSRLSSYSGAAYHQSGLASGLHQHYFSGAIQTLQINAGDRLYAYVYLDPVNPPSEVMLQFAASGESGHPHRAYWGANNIPFGTDGTASRRYMGPLPPAGQWVRLEVPANLVGLEGKTLNGMAFTLYGGRASWDKAGKVRYVNNGAINGRAYTVNTATNRLTMMDGVAMSYDAAGNQTNDGSGERIYDGENRMVKAYNGAVLVSEYVYDADGKRVRRIIGGQETWQVYGMGGELLAEYVAGAAPSAAQKEYGYRNGQMLVVWDGSEIGDRKLQWLVQDHLGSTRMVVDRSGSLAEIRRHDYLPFGEELGSGIGIRSASIGYSGDSVRQKFTGKERDDETGLDFFQARYFSSVQGRFTSPDEFTGGPDELYFFASTASENPTFYADLTTPQSLNKYQYTYNNPLRYTDPDGHCAMPMGICRDVVGGILKSVANTFIGIENQGRKYVTGQDPVEYYQPTTEAEAAVMETTDKALILGGLLGGRAPANVAMAEGKQAAALTAAEAGGSGGHLVRFGKGPETAQELATQAAAAEKAGFPHGVSTKLVKRVSGTDKANRSAPMEEVKKEFVVEQTGKNKNHHTVHLPKPVTQKVADKFNRVFKPKKNGDEE
jgi:RHS repeat-associated protein